MHMNEASETVNTPGLATVAWFSHGGPSKREASDANISLSVKVLGQGNYTIRGHVPSCNLKKRKPWLSAVLWITTRPFRYG